MNILYISNFHDGDSYARESRERVIALDQSGANVVCRPVTYNGGKKFCEKIIFDLEDKNIEKYDFVIQHMPPDMLVYDARFPINICSFSLASDRVAKNGCNSIINEFNCSLLSTNQLKTACLNSGISININVIPNSSNTEKYFKKYPVFNAIKEIHESKKFVFYAITRLEEMKDVRTLIDAFVLEFSYFENVCLVLKMNDEKQKVSSLMETAKEKIKGRRPADIYIINADLKETDLMSLHKNFHCYVNASSGTGWSYSTFDAMAMGKAPIVTKGTGTNEYINESVGWIADSSFTNVDFSHADQKIYNCEHKIYKVNKDSLRKCMREAFVNRDMLEEKSSNGLDRSMLFDSHIIGKQLIGVLNHEAQKKLGTD